MNTKIEETSNVLLVEDSDELRQLLRYFLSRHNCKIIEAEDGQTGFEMAQQYSPDLILMDLRLPVLNGIAATWLIRNDPKLRDVPIVIFTALDPALFREAALSVGANDFISKPIIIDDLREILHRYLQKASTVPVMMTHIPSPEPI